MITIAIPLYNAEKYISRCLESVLDQTYKDLEILVINDCSTDNGLIVAESLFLKNKSSIKLRILNQCTNQGVGMARNRAIDEAEGNFIYFLDSDDFITPNCMEVLHNTIQQTHSNFVIGSYCNYSDGDYENRKCTVQEYAQLHSNQDFLKYKYSFTKNSLFTIYIWNVLFDIHFIRTHQIRFKPLRKGEDQIFFLELMPYIKSCVILPNVTYHYIQRNDSLSNYGYRNSISTQEINDNVSVLKCKLNIIKKWKNNYFYPEIMSQQIKDSFWMLLSIMKKKNIIKPFFPIESFNFLSCNPLSLSQVIKLRRMRFFHLSFYLFGIFPLFFKKLLLSSYLNLQKINIHIKL
jgi:glycosyltransferase involved in cell wall biosynthesis